MSLRSLLNTGFANSFWFQLETPFARVTRVRHRRCAIRGPGGPRRGALQGDRAGDGDAARAAADADVDGPGDHHRRPRLELADPAGEARDRGARVCTSSWSGRSPATRSTGGWRTSWPSPTPTAANPSSVMGVSTTRLSPNSFQRPRVTLYAPSYSATSSPIMKTFSSRISSSRSLAFSSRSSRS